MRISRLLGMGTAAVLAASLAACSTTTADTASTSSSAGGDGAFPISIDHVYGTTEITQKPERIATVAWSNNEVPLALGIVPVGMAKVTWGDDDNDGVLPWVEDKLEELGAETPVLFDETDGIDFEAVADTNPDLILASYSGISKEDYETLSRIAPVVAYPEIAWGTSLEDMITLNSTAMGMAAEGAALIDDLHAQVEAALAKHETLRNAAPIFAHFDPSDLSKIDYYTAADTRPGFLSSLGLPMPSIVQDSTDSDQFFLTVSAENADALSDVDLIVAYGDDSTVATLQADPLLSKIPAIASGRVAILETSTPLAASANPSPLSIPWGIDDYFATLEAPLTK